MQNFFQILTVLSFFTFVIESFSFNPVHKSERIHFDSIPLIDFLICLEQSNIIDKIFVFWIVYIDLVE